MRQIELKQFKSVIQALLNQCVERQKEIIEKIDNVILRIKAYSGHGDKLKYSDLNSLNEYCIANTNIYAKINMIEILYNYLNSLESNKNSNFKRKIYDLFFYMPSSKSILSMNISTEDIEQIKTDINNYVYQYLLHAPHEILTHILIDEIEFV